MDFATLPPEINSGLMHSGPGTGSMMRAAAAWETLATRLFTAAAGYRAVTARLDADGEAPAVTEAATRYAGWLDAVAARSRHAAIQLKLAAGAHQSAFTATVPPPEIAGNRTRRMSLVSKNFLGQKSGAIADIDAEYDAMWAQNAAAMRAYAESAARAVTIAPFPAPPATPTVTQRNWGTRFAPDVLSAGREVMSVIPEALRRLSSPRTTFEASLSSITASLSKLTSVTAPSDFAIGHLNSMNKTAALRSLFPKPVPTNRVDAGLGRGTPVGGLSVPRTWAAAAPTTERPRGDWVGEPIHLVALSEPPGEHAADIFGG